MTVQAKFGDVRSVSDLENELRLQLHDVISQAIRIGRGTFGMSSENVNQWVQQQIDTLAGSWAAAVEVKRSSAAAGQVEEAPQPKRKEK